ncbi:MAG TPA: tripartite tricarboxylate transporter TctA [Halomonas sp.]|jgi:putative tricarboxylic transport membrane protein|uniref:tripartite tricarboxylate transporter permease n=1 Tax=Halomonadaceae TaxID=28256 RepID=UPI0005CC66B4|nr:MULTISPECIES: tripartite tricarboxylate transporter permease [Halomonas]KJD18135.1 tripartite tricarboxylate transporter TctA [Halomonas meridiana]MCO7241836.1 tripartite tricarboxylate transporter permease [Halomonas sp. Ps84H-12]HAV43744.1 tripartite tricarboxylate transporter TctA [Halomonas sp.]HBM42520.1 tripartite tricarboxylate transporter TctA [Halomonas sp.]|tara:strand:+ start:2024 stop:3529 length:1506 start_codon:yes stop_codon:yes gene_type:complete
MFDFLIEGFGVALTPLNLGLALLGALLGTLFGALPGIGPINGIAILMPLAYTLGLPAESSLILLAAVYTGAEYGGRMSSILLNVPGDAGAVMTTLDGYPLAQRGLAGPALGLSAVSSFIGATIAILGLTLFAPLLAKVAVLFGPAEFFALMVFAFSSMSVMMGKDPIKTAIGAVLGILIGTVGIDSGSGVLRYTFGMPELYDGIDFVVMIIGLFAISEILLMLEHSQRKGDDGELPVLGRVFVRLKEVLWCKGAIIRSGLIGFIIGVLPGTGASVAGAVSYTTEKRLSDKDNTFGTGDMRGLAAPESANNAAAVGSFVPMLTLGIPGSGTTAVLLGALMLYNITPGPMMFIERPEVAGGLIASLYIGNIVLLMLNLPLAGVFARVLTIPRWVLVPAIAILAFVGVYQLHSDLFAIYLMLLIGVFGYLLRKLGFSLAPVILGYVLGGLMEQNLRRALSISGGDVGILWQSGISLGLWVAAVLLLVLPWWIPKLLAARQPSTR